MKLNKKFSYLFKYFSKEQKIIIVCFLKLMSKPDFSDDRERDMIEKSLTFF